MNENGSPIWKWQVPDEYKGANMEKKVYVTETGWIDKEGRSHFRQRQEDGSLLHTISWIEDETKMNDPVPVDTSNVKYMDIAEFRAHGYLQEVNRCWFHPLGMALEVMVTEDGLEYLSGIWDYRDDPEGIMYADDGIDVSKFLVVAAEIGIKYNTRHAALGYVFQPPLPYGDPEYDELEFVEIPHDHDHSNGE